MEELIKYGHSVGKEVHIGARLQGCIVGPPWQHSTGKFIREHPEELENKREPVIEMLVSLAGERIDRYHTFWAQ